MIKVFLDTNIVADVVMQRGRDMIESLQIFGLIEKKKFKGYISSNTFTTLAYLMHKNKIPYAHDTLGKILSFCEVVPVEKKDCILSLQLKRSDIEDSLQYICALKCGAEMFITRNGKDFLGSTIHVIAPGQILNEYT